MPNSEPTGVRATVDEKMASRGFLAAVLAYLLWGVFPLLFRMVDGIDALTVLSHRVIWALPVIGIFLAVSGRLGEVATALKDRRTATIITIAAAALAVNWYVFVWAVEAHHVLDTSFGYFINPIVNVLLGMVLLGERQNRVQMVAIALAVIAIAIQWVGLGTFPLISMALAFSFGIYGYLRKTVNVGSAPGLMIETLLLFPLAAGYLAYTFVTAGGGPHVDPVKFGWLVLTGPATAIALVLFAFGARQLRLTTLGFIQYLAPSMHFLTAIFLFNEQLNPLRLTSFALVWLALVVFSVDSWRRRKPQTVITRSPG